MSKKRDKLLKPASLIPGDTIGVVAPAGPFDREKFKRGVAVLERMGFAVKVPQGLFRKQQYLAGGDRHRADILNRLFEEPSVKGIVCARGGFGSVRILDYLDFGIIRRNPKFFSGFSDVTVLLTALSQECRMVVFHGPMVTSLATADTASKKAFFQAATSTEKIRFALARGRILRPGRATGPVIGTNLATLCSLVGTPYAPELAGHILVLEDIGEAPYKIDRMLTQMRMAGCLSGLAGLVLGSFLESGRIDGILKVFEKAFMDFDIPVIAGFDVGHGRRNLSLPIGLAATLDTDRHVLQYHEPAVIRACRAQGRRCP